MVLASPASAPQPQRLSRREVLHAAASVSLGLALEGAAMAAPGASELPLITKRIPSTGEELPVIGIGTNQFSVSSPEDIAARRDVIRELPRLGGKLIDTAAQYGEAEAVIGRLVKEIGNRDQLFLATKTPMFGPADDRAVVDNALARMQVSKLDLLEIHNFNHLEELFPVLLDAKHAGTVRYVGVTTSSPSQHPQLLEAIRSKPLDFIQVDYSIADRTAEEVLAAAHDKGVGVLINVPLGGRGRSLLPRVKDKPLPPFAKEIDVTSWPQLLLKYIVSHPAVTATIPGTTKVEHLIDNQQAGRGRLPDAALRKKIEEYWASV